MSRRSQTVRTYGQAQAVARPRSANEFSWNAMARSYETTFVDGYNTVPLQSEFPRHTSLGTDTDFDYSEFPVLKIIIPRDGIYSVSARASVTASDDPEGVEHLSTVVLNIFSDSPIDGFVDTDQRTLEERTDEAASAETLLGCSQAGWPFVAGNRIWAGLENRTANLVYAQLWHLSVTYEAQLGTYYNHDSGGG